jgi:hypothetical protein
LIRRLLFCSDSKSQLSSGRDHKAAAYRQEKENEEDGSNIESITALLLVLLFGSVAIAAIIRSGCCCR